MERQSRKKRNTRGYLRYVRRKTIYRKKYIVEHIRYFPIKYDGQLSKGKVHCGCYLCRGMDYKERKHSERVRIDAMQREEKGGCD